MAHSWDYFFFLLEISKLARRVTGTASTDMSVAAPVLMLCLFLLSELFSLISDILSVNQLLNIITSAFDTIIIVLLGGLCQKPKGLSPGTFRELCVIR